MDGVADEYEYLPFWLLYKVVSSAAVISLYIHAYVFGGARYLSTWR